MAWPRCPRRSPTRARLVSGVVRQSAPPHTQVGSILQSDHLPTDADLPAELQVLWLERSPQLSQPNHTSVTGGGGSTAPFSEALPFFSRQSKCWNQSRFLETPCCFLKLIWGRGTFSSFWLNHGSPQARQATPGLPGSHCHPPPLGRRVWPSPLCPLLPRQPTRDPGCGWASAAVWGGGLGERPRTCHSLRGRVGRGS